MKAPWVSSIRIVDLVSAQRDLLDAQRLHRHVMAAFSEELPEHARAAVAAMYRIDGKQLTVQSAVNPRWRLPPWYAVERVEPLRGWCEIETGRRMSFVLRAEPAKKTRASHPERRHSSRVAIRDPLQRVEWIVARMAQRGAQLDREAMSIVALTHMVARRDGNSAHINPVDFKGTLTVTDEAALRAAVVAGVGSGKSYGCGLLQLAPVLNSDRVAEVTS